MQHELDHFTNDWVEEITGKSRNKDEYIGKQHRRCDQATRRSSNQRNAKAKAIRCNLDSNQPVQICFDFLQKRKR